MKRILSVLMMCVLSSMFALAAPPHATLIPVKATHPHAQRHHAHKAGKHHTPKRHHHASV